MEFIALPRFSKANCGGTGVKAPHSDFLLAAAIVFRRYGRANDQPVPRDVCAQASQSQ
jgi:hypothetical protein